MAIGIALDNYVAGQLDARHAQSLLSGQRLLLGCDTLADLYATLTETLCEYLGGDAALCRIGGRPPEMPSAATELGRYVGFSDEFAEAHYLYHHDDPALSFKLDSWHRRQSRMIRYSFSKEDVTSPYYRNVVRPQGLDHSLGITMPLADSWQCTFGVVRGSRRGAFSDDDANLLAMMEPMVRATLERLRLARCLDLASMLSNEIKTSLEYRIAAVLDETLKFVYIEDPHLPLFQRRLRPGSTELCELEPIEAIKTACRTAQAACDQPHFVNLRTRRQLDSHLEIRVRRTTRGHYYLLCVGRREDFQAIEIDHALTRAEQKVADLVVTGCSNRDIAKSLSLSTSTVAKHVARAIRKVGVRNRAGLAIKCTHSSPITFSGDASLLTKRERRVALHVCEGLDIATIAHTLGISAVTVSNHLQAIYRKLNVHNRVSLIRSMNRTDGQPKNPVR